MRKKEIHLLKNPSVLAAFYEVYSTVSPDEFHLLIANNRQQIINVARRFKSNTMKAYFAYILHTLQLHSNDVSNDFNELMMEFVLEKSVYVRENSLKVLYSFGNAYSIAKSFRTLSKKNIFHSEKLLTDGLMSFQGDFDHLTTLLMAYFEDFIECYQIAIINALAYKNEHKFDNELLKYIGREDISIDIKCSILRIIGKAPSEKHKQILILCLKQHESEYGWEQAVVAASMLGNFMNDVQVEKALCETITSRNWYVRMKSAKSLIRIGLSDEHIQEIINGDDAYAKNALLYTLNPGKEYKSND